MKSFKKKIFCKVLGDFTDFRLKTDSTRRLCGTDTLDLYNMFLPQWLIAD